MAQNIKNEPSFLEYIKQQNNPAAQYGLNVPQSPQVGPTIASDSRAVPMMGGFEVRGEGADRFPLGIPEDKLIPQPVTNTPQVEAQVPQANEGGFFSTIGDIATKVFAPTPTSRTAASGAMFTGGATSMPQEPVKTVGEMATSARAAIPLGLPGSLPFTPQTEPQAAPQPDVPMATPESVANLSITGTPLTQGAITSPSIQSPQVQAPQAPQVAQAPQGLTTQSGIPLAQFLSGEAIPEAGLAAESPLYSSASRGISGDAGQGIMEQESAARMAGTFSPAGAGRAVSDRERRMATGEGVSMADRTDMAKANARGASPRDVARGQKIADELGVDLKTGQPLDAQGGLTFDQQLALRKQKFAEGKYKSEQVDKATESYNSAVKEAQEAKTAEQKSVSVGRGLTQSVDDMITVMDRAAGRLDQFFSTGMTGKLSSFWKGSDADSQESDFGFLKSNVALNAMMELKANSPTGSTGFGALNTEELKVLQSQFAALDPFNDPDVVRKNLAQLQGRFDGIIRNAYDQHKADYGEEAANSVYGKMIDRLDSRKQPEGQATTGSTSTQTKSGNYTVEVSY